MSDLNWNLREILHEFKDSRLPVFISIFLHKNTRNRSWPSNELIATETGLSSAPISAAIGWMIESNVCVLVPYEKRVGLELKLSNRKNIYQLTGVVLVAEEYYPYMNLTPEGWQSIAADLEDMGNSLLSKQLNDVDSLLSKCLDSKRKGIKGIALDSEGIKNNTSSPKGKGRKPDPQFDTIARIWNITAGGWVSNMQGMIFGSKKVKGEWLKCEFEPHATLDELQCFEPYLRQRMAEKNIKDVPTAAVTIQRWFYDYRADVERKAQPAQSSQPTEAELNTRSPARRNDEKFQIWLKEQEAIK